MLENANRHGKPPIRVEVKRRGAGAILEVLDHGDGIAEADREGISEYALAAPFIQLLT